MSEIYDGEDLWQCSQLKIRLNAFLNQPYQKSNSPSSSVQDMILLFYFWCESRELESRKNSGFSCVTPVAGILCLWLKYWRERGASHHQAFMLNCTTVSNTFLALSTQWINFPSREWRRGVSPKFHLIGLSLVRIKRIRRQGEFNLV